MKRTETLEMLIEIQEAIEYFEHKIDMSEWSNGFGLGAEFESICKKNTHNIEIFHMCIGRLNERFTKQLITIVDVSQLSELFSQYNGFVNMQYLGVGLDDTDIEDFKGWLNCG